MHFERWFYTVPLRLRSLFRRRQVERELDEEFRYHLERRAEEFIAKGLTPEEARYAALRAMGGVEQRKEECRDMRRVNLIEELVQDLRYGLRILRRSPGFTLTAVITLALGIGANTAIFSVVFGVVLRPLPYPESERLVALWTEALKHGLPRAYVGAANYRDWRKQNQVFEDIALVRHIANFNLVGEGEPERLQGARVSANLFSVLRTQPLWGRVFTEEEDEIGHDGVVLLSYNLWQRRFGEDRNVVGKTIRLNGEPHTVVGVMGPDFQYPGSEFELWKPLTVDPQEFQTRLGYNFLAVGRLKAGVTLRQAQTDLDIIAARLEKQYRDTNDGIGVALVPLLEDTVGAVRKPLYLLLGAVGCMLLIGCVNLTNLLLARSAARTREMTVRAALGATRARLVRQAMNEMLPVLILGGGLGWLIASWSVNLLVRSLPASMPRVFEIRLDAPVLAFTACLLIFVGLFVGIWPALQSGRMNLVASLKEDSRAMSGGPAGRTLRDWLVISQIALAAMLTVGACLLIRTFSELKAVDPGFRPDRVLSMHLAIPRSKYASDRQVAAFCHQLLERVSALPEVESAGMVNRLPLGGGVQTGSIEFEGKDSLLNKFGSVDWRTVTPDYFRTMRVPLVRGRFFTERDTAVAKLVGIIDDRIARLVWPNEDPVGKRFRIPLQNLPWVEIVGVVGHIRHDSLDTDPRPQIYWNYLQRAQDRMALVVRAHNEPKTLAASVLATIRSLDAEQSVYQVGTMDDVIGRSLSQRRLNTVLLAMFALVSVLLASLGTYGVISYSVSQRVREFGIRIALGAQQRDVVGLVMRHGAALALVGSLIGLGGALALARLMNDLLYGVPNTDWMSFSSAALVLATVALIAAFLPAWRASRVDPVVALRYE